ncbi:hypothetical protein DER45DRAFT_619349 [Fusarium avenaceum]|nr:hypothetical protein DER45DRAFT_619349 [Fusarium avenaceum]
MGVSRACRPCRIAKTRCDLHRPTCSRCSKRNTFCEGYTPDAEYLFRSENETARANSQRSRRLPTHTKISGPVLFKLEDRALEVFYAEWVRNPHHQNKGPGYLDLLPSMKARAESRSALSLSVEAFALANAGNLLSSKGKLSNLARAKYGATLSVVRTAIMNDAFAADDSTLMAILTIDMFEVVFMVREEPLKLHCNAIEHMLTSKGSGQIGFSISSAVHRMANHRLQVRQLGLGLGPLPVQLACIDTLDPSRPSQCLVGVQLRAQQTIALSRNLFSEDSLSIPTWDHLSSLLSRIYHNLDELEAWNINLPELWKPKRIELAEHEHVLRDLISNSLPFTPHVWIYEDPWLAHQMAFFYQGQIVLRTALLDIVDVMKHYDNTYLGCSPVKHEIAIQETTILSQGDILMESITPLLALIELDDAGAIHLAGNKISRCYARAICWTLQQGTRLPAKHKDFARQAEDWMRSVSDIY